MRNDNLLDIRNMPLNLRNKQFVVRHIPRGDLSEALSMICESGSIDFICDSFLNSKSYTQYSTFFKVGKVMTIEKALREAAKMYAHRIVYRNGILEAATAIRGLDLRLEPPKEVINSLDDELKSKRLPDRNDILALAKCSKDQLALIILRHPASKIDIYLINSYRCFPLMHFLGQLSPEQQATAFSDAGQDVRLLNRRLRDEFYRLVAAGVFHPSQAILLKNHFYNKTHALVISPQLKREVLTLIATTPHSGAKCLIGDI